MALQAALITRNIDDISNPTMNIYSSINIIAKRSRQISITVREELNAKLAEFASTVDNLEEVFENREQIEISRFYERMPKPTMVAMNEFLEGGTMFRKAVQEGEE